MKRDDILETRRQRLIFLKDVECRGKNVVLAEKIGKSDSYVSRMLLPAEKPQSKSIGEETARQIEKAFNKPSYWLDGVGESLTHASAKIISEMSGMSMEEVLLGEDYGSTPVKGSLYANPDGSIMLDPDFSGYLLETTCGVNTYSIKIDTDNFWPRMNSGEFIVVDTEVEIHSGDEVFVRTKTGEVMLKTINITRDGNYQLSGLSGDQKPITLSKDHIDEISFISAIIKSNRFVDEIK